MGALFKGDSHVVVQVNGRHVLELSLRENVTRKVIGPLGATVIVVENNSVRIVESACPNKWCIHMGSISHRGEIIVCAPNHVVVTISGGSGKESFDGVSQ